MYSLQSVKHHNKTSCFQSQMVSCRSESSNNSFVVKFSFLIASGGAAKVDNVPIPQHLKRKFMSCSHCQELGQLPDLASDWLFTFADLASDWLLILTDLASD